MRPTGLIWLLGLAALGCAAGLVHFRREAAAGEARARALSRELAEARFTAKQLTQRAETAEASLAQLDTHLGAAKTKTTVVEVRSTRLAAELQEARSALSERQQRELALLTELESLRQTVRPQPAAGASPASEPDPAVQKRIAALEAQLAALLTRALAEPPPAAATVPAGPIVHQVVRVGRADAFVIVDYGADHGAVRGEPLTLIRGTSEVGRVQISDVRARFSVAQVLPGRPNAQLQTGDRVILAK